MTAERGARAGQVRVGICSWTDPTLVKSHRFYPPGTGSAEARLRYYATQFPVVEADGSFYALPSQEMTGQWVERTPDDFTFNVKAFGLLTGHPVKRAAVPADLLATASKDDQAKPRIYASHLAPDAVEEAWRRFYEAMLPLDSAGKLGAVLVQYPEWFTPRRASRDELGRLHDRLPGLGLCVEFRNAAWLTGDDADRTLGLLRDLELPLVVVDMPQGFRSSLPALTEVTDPRLAVVRFHGRDPEAWARKGGPARERFRYLYSPTELAEWVPRVHRLAEQAAEVHVMMNNCYSDHAVVNARQLADLLAAFGEPALVQPTLPGTSDPEPGTPAGA